MAEPVTENSRGATVRRHQPWVPAQLTEDRLAQRDGALRGTSLTSHGARVPPETRAVVDAQLSHRDSRRGEFWAVVALLWLLLALALALLTRMRWKSSRGGWNRLSAKGICDEEENVALSHAHSDPSTSSDEEEPAEAVWLRMPRGKSPPDESGGPWEVEGLSQSRPERAPRAPLTPRVRTDVETLIGQENERAHAGCDEDTRSAHGVDKRASACFDHHDSSDEEEVCREGSALLGRVDATCREADAVIERACAACGAASRAVKRLGRKPLGVASALVPRPAAECRCCSDADPAQAAPQSSMSETAITTTDDPQTLLTASCEASTPRAASFSSPSCFAEPAKLLAPDVLISTGGDTLVGQGLRLEDSVQQLHAGSTLGSPSHHQRAQELTDSDWVSSPFWMML